MPTNVAMFLFLGAAVVAVFAFCSIVVWVSVPLRERQARERLALLQALAENPGENAMRVLEFLREEDARRAANRARQDRKSWIVGGLIMMAVGAGLGVMLLEIGDRGDWAVGLIPFMIGCVLVVVGALIKPAVRSVENSK
jgi:hypothetical protein